VLVKRLVADGSIAARATTSNVLMVAMDSLNSAGCRSSTDCLQAVEIVRKGEVSHVDARPGH